LLDFFAVFFAATEAIDFLEVFVIVLSTESLLSLLSLFVVVVINFVLPPLMLSWLLLSEDSQKEGVCVRIISNIEVKK
jgi:hypothetical protein